jgi:hypothetical protein
LGLGTMAPPLPAKVALARRQDAGGIPPARTAQQSDQPGRCRRCEPSEADAKANRTALALPTFGNVGTSWSDVTAMARLRPPR